MALLNIVITSIDTITSTSCKIHYTASKHQSAWYDHDVIELPNDGFGVWNIGLYWLILQSLEPGTDYSVYLRGKDTSGDAWENSNTELFSTLPVVPGKPTNPSPSHTASDITLDESPLSWDASSPAADTYEIYFREQGESWDLIGTAQAGVSFVLDFGYIDYNITYEWRIDATNIAGTTTGDTWNFDSIVFAPPNPADGGIGGGGGSGEESSPTGESNMITLRRLVAAAGNAIYYEDI